MFYKSSLTGSSTYLEVSRRTDVLQIISDRELYLLGSLKEDGCSVCECSIDVTIQKVDHAEEKHTHTVHTCTHTRAHAHTHTHTHTQYTHTHTHCGNHLLQTTE